MKERKNEIDTQDELIRNFSKEQLDIYNYYKNKFTNVESDENLTQESKLEKIYNLLSNLFKVEIAVAVTIFIVVFSMGGLKNSSSRIATSFNVSSIYLQLNK